MVNLTVEEEMPDIPEEDIPKGSLNASITSSDRFSDVADYHLKQREA